ncbi:MAG: DUF2721 domain-containing protein [Anaerolineales bacterium]|nr:MAG: DUF2721 domain-containing protein [Anaerolineales bacterium]
MDIPSVAQLIPVLQTAIGPMILISGIGLLLLTMTNRLGRAIDRTRVLVGGLSNTAEAKREKTVAQLRILWDRARMIRLAIALASVSALATAILIIVLFTTALWQMESAWVIVTLFMVSLVSLIVSLVIFIRDINQSLAALKLELAAEEVIDF